jgi:hypothetical protein
MLADKAQAEKTLKISQETRKKENEEFKKKIEELMK